MRFNSDSVAIRTQDPRLRSTFPQKGLIDLFSVSYNAAVFQKKQVYLKSSSKIPSILLGMNEGQDSMPLFLASR